jgi:hypothetical protein
MASTSVRVGENHGVPQDVGTGRLIRVILADTQAIFRAGLRKIFALEDDIRVVGQAETLPQTQSAVTKFSADVLIFESSHLSYSAEGHTAFCRAKSNRSCWSIAFAKWHPVNPGSRTKPFIG